MTTVGGRFKAAMQAFMHPQRDSSDASNDRLKRYIWYEQLVDNTAYKDIAGLRQAAGIDHLYRYTRGLRNPLARYVNFYVANVWGGTLDAQAGDGSGTATALPIVTENEQLRAAIAMLWQWSNWGTRRQLAVRQGTSLGDAFIKVVDRPDAQRVYMQVRHPSQFTDVTWDNNGFIKRCVIEYEAIDNNGKPYTYKEIITHPLLHGGDGVLFETFKNNKPFAYADNVIDENAAAAWEEDYDFVPVVHVPFQVTGAGWGAVAFMHALPKIVEADASASILHDQLGRLLNSPLLAIGISASNIQFETKPDSVPVLAVEVPEKTPFQPTVTPLIGNMNLLDALQAVNKQVEAVERDLPELRLSDALQSGMSGEALGRAFSDVAAAVADVRASFDSALVRVQQMAITIAAMGRYDDVFSHFNKDSYQSGALDHYIGQRPVLPRGSSEELAEMKERWNIASVAVGMDVPQETALAEIVRWNDAKIASMTAARKRWIDGGSEDDGR